MSYKEELHVPSPPAEERESIIVDGVRCLEEGAANEQVNFMLDRLHYLVEKLDLSCKGGSDGRRINELISQEDPLMIEGVRTYEELS